jgi:SAM-dependent methyltransferase
MNTPFNETDRDKIQKAIRKKYSKAAESPEGLFKYPTGRAGLEALQYDAELIGGVPAAVINSYCGVGNPFSLGPISAGNAVLDIGCGAGVDTLIAAMMTGPSGRVCGIDSTPEMLARAEENLSRTHLRNVTFQKASAENLPFPDSEFNIVISNGALNLIPDKTKALSEAHRVLKPGGRLMIADQILTGRLPADTEQIIKSWSQ